MHWGKACINKLIEEEMCSRTQVEQDNFKVAIEQFAIRFNIVQAELDSAVKNKQSQVAKWFEAAKLQSAMVFGQDNKPIIGIEATPVLLSGSSIALNHTWKRKWDEIGGSGPSQDAILLSKTFERLTTILAKTLVRIEKASSLSARQAASVPTATSARLTESSRAGLNSLAQILDKKMSDIENCIKEKMENQWNNIQGKLDLILVAIDMLSNNNN